MVLNASTDHELALRIYLLGEFRVAAGTLSVPHAAWRLRRARSLVKLLALSPEHRLHREQVIDRLWPGQDLAAAGNSLNQVIHAARRALAHAGVPSAQALCLRADMLLLAPEQPVWTDIEAFEEAARQARHSHDDAAAYQTAIGLYSGDLLPEDRFEEWTVQPRKRLSHVYLDLLSHLASLCESTGDPVRATLLLRALLEREPTSENACSRLMRLLAAMGRHDEALRQYHMLRAALRRDLDLNPQPATQRLYDDIHALRASPSASQAAAEPVAKGSARAGEGSDMRLAPSDSGNADQPMAASAALDFREPPARLPMPATPFIGRAYEQHELDRLLSSSRLLTITGPGGSGKTRLALQLASERQHAYADGTWFVGLASVGQSALVVQAVATALGLRERVGEPLMMTICAHLEEKQMLLVVDNCEHVLTTCADFATLLLERCPHLHMLATSREPMHVAGEVCWRLSSLPVLHPTSSIAAADLSDNDAVQLFLQQACAVLPTFQLNDLNASAVARICYRLDGLPLAIELAAARISSLSPEQIGERLDDCFRLLVGGTRSVLSRQRTLAATLDWSYGLLNATEQLLFRRLAVFAGGFDLAAAESICADAALAQEDVLDVLAALVEKSLVVADVSMATTRYRLLEPIRQYADRHLESSSEAGRMRACHRDWFVQFATQADQTFWGSGHSAAVGRLVCEYDNLCAALTFCLQHDGEADAGLRLAQALWQFWLLRGMLAEGRRWFERLLTRAPRLSAEHAAALIRVYGLASRQLEYALPPAYAWLRQSAAICRDLDDAHGLAHALRTRGSQAYLLEAYEEATTAFAESALVAQHDVDVAGQALAACALGTIAMARGDLEHAEGQLHEGITLLQAVADQQRPVAFSLLNQAMFDLRLSTIAQRVWVDEETWVLLRSMNCAAALGYALANLGNLHRIRGTITTAHTHFDASRACFERLDDRAGLAHVLNQQGNLYRQEQRFTDARALLEESLALRRDLGEQRGIGRTMNNLGVLAMAEGDYGQAAAIYEESLRLFDEMGDLVGTRATCDNQGHLALAQGNYALALQLYEQSVSLSRRMVDPKESDGYGIYKVGLAEYLLGETARARAHLETSRARFAHTGQTQALAISSALLEIVSAS